MIAQSSDSHCPICRSRTGRAYSVTILKKHASELRACATCDFCYLSPVYWLDEAYAQSINVTDIGYVWRNNSACQFVSSLLISNFDSKDLFLDFGAGYGMFVRLMRDRGFRFQYYDPSCQNLFSRFNEAKLNQRSRYKLVTAIEVIERTIDPVASVREMLNYADSILLSTEITPSTPPDPEWWYLGFEHGQHIGFFGERSFIVLADNLSLKYMRIAGNWHLLSTADINLRKQPTSRIGRAINRLYRAKRNFRSLMISNFEATRTFLDDPELAARFGNSIDEYYDWQEGSCRAD